MALQIVGHCNTSSATDMIIHNLYKNTLFDFPIVFKTVCDPKKWEWEGGRDTEGFVSLGLILNFFGHLKIWQIIFFFDKLHTY